MKTLISARAVRSIRRWAMALVLGMALLATNVAPALAIGSTPTSPKDGEANLTKIEQKSKDVLKNGPRGMEEVQARAEGGLNGVQGSADSSKMTSPSETQATTVMDDVKNLLKDATD